MGDKARCVSCRETTGYPDARGLCLECAAFVDGVDPREELARLRGLEVEVVRLRAELASAENCYHWRRNQCTPNDSE